MLKLLLLFRKPWKPRPVDIAVDAAALITAVAQNAQAYGFEIGRGKKPADAVVTSPDNPFQFQKG